MTALQRVRWLVAAVPFALRLVWSVMRQPPEFVQAKNETMWNALIGELQGVSYHLAMLEEHITPDDERLDAAQESIGHAIAALEAWGEANVAAA